MTLDEPDTRGHRPSGLVEDDVVGYTARTGYGYTIDAGIAYGYLPTEHAEAGQTVEIQYEGRSYAATVRDEPLFDPGREKILR